jgi:hypothetical protein
MNYPERLDIAISGVDFSCDLPAGTAIIRRSMDLVLDCAPSGSSPAARIRQIGRHFITASPSQIGSRSLTLLRPHMDGGFGTHAAIPVGFTLTATAYLS